jgi:hypothetical protein
MQCDTLLRAARERLAGTFKGWVDVVDAIDSLENLEEKQQRAERLWDGAELAKSTIVNSPIDDRQRYLRSPLSAS